MNNCIIEIDISKEQMKFSAGHFTIFSATERENMHGHNFTVGAIFKARVAGNGMICDYGIMKRSVIRVCSLLDEYFLLPANSPYLHVINEDNIVYAKFQDETLQFLQRDVKILPVTNVTVEELSGWVLQEIRHALTEEIDALMLEISVRVTSGPGQGATTRWIRAETAA